MTTTRQHLSLLAAFFVTSPLAVAQVVSVSVRAQTPLTVTATGPSPVSQTIPIGPMTQSGGISANAPTSGYCALTWYGGSGPTLASVQMIHELLGSAVAGPHDIVVEFTATAPTPISLSVEQAFAGSIGGTIPEVLVDVGNDGTYELGFVSSYSATAGNFTLGAQPLAVRIHFDGATDATSSALVSTLVRALPRNDVVVTEVAAGCSQQSIVQPGFNGRGVAALGFSPPLNAPSVLVVGFAPQPVLLPPLAAPCLLYPQVDLLLPFWHVPMVEIPLPASVRPAELYLQRATLFAGQIAVDDAFRVQAQ